MHQEQIKQNLLSPAAWLRILYMLGFAVAAWLTLSVLGVIVLGQAVLVLITGRPNVNLQRFGLIAGAYLFELIQFLLYNTEDKPFPFSPFPDPPGAEVEDVPDFDDHDDPAWETGPGAGLTVTPPIPPASEPEPQDPMSGRPLP